MCKCNFINLHMFQRFIGFVEISMSKNSYSMSYAFIHK